jgi:acetylglutamate kinase
LGLKLLYKSIMLFIFTAMLVVKIGGNIIDNEIALNSFLKDFAKLNGPKILIHGGGKIASALAKTMGIETKMIDGRRITDAETLKLVTMVYGGLINKNIVAQLQAFECNAVGVCGVDGNLLLAQKKEHPSIDFGFIGSIQSVDTTILELFFENNFVPVVAPLTHDKNGNLLNTNADDIASNIAIALSKKYDVTFVYCFEKKGLLLDIENEDSVLSSINISEIEKLKTEGIVTDGMIPKVDNIKFAIESGVQKVILCHASEINNLNNNIGTTFKP